MKTAAHAGFYRQSKHTRIDIERYVKKPLLKENSTALQLIKPKEFLKTQTGYKERGGFHQFFFFSVCRWG